MTMATRLTGQKQNYLDEQIQNTHKSLKKRGTAQTETQSTDT